MIELTLFETIALALLGLVTILNAILLTLIILRYHKRKEEWVISALKGIIRLSVMECVNGEKYFRINTRSYTLEEWLDIILGDYYVVEDLSTKDVLRIRSTVLQSIKITGILNWPPNDPQALEETIDYLIDALNIMQHNGTKHFSLEAS